MSISEKFRKGSKNFVEGVNEIIKEDEAWKSEFHFLKKDEYKAEKLKEDFLRVEEVNESPAEFSKEFTKFIKDDFHPFLKMELVELRSMLEDQDKPDYDKIKRRSDAILFLIHNLDMVLEEVTNDIGGDRQQRKERWKNQKKAELIGLEDKLEEIEPKFEDINNAAVENL